MQFNDIANAFPRKILGNGLNSKLHASIAVQGIFACKATPLLGFVILRYERGN